MNTQIIINNFLYLLSTHMVKMETYNHTFIYNLLILTTFLL